MQQERAATERPGRGRSSRLRVFFVLASTIAVIAGVTAGVLIYANATANPFRHIKPTQTFADADGSGAQAVAISPDDTLLAVGDLNDNVYLWNIRSQDILTALAVPAKADNTVQSVAFSPNGELLAIGDSNGHAYLWNTATRRITANLANPATSNGGVTAVTFSPNGKLLAIGDYNGTTYLWNVAAKRKSAALAYSNTGNGGIGAVAFSPDGLILASGDRDTATTYLWSTVSKHAIGALSDPHSSAAGVTALTFAPNGSTLAAVDSSGKHLSVEYRYSTYGRYPSYPGRGRSIQPEWQDASRWRLFG